ncbi:MAG: Mitochondrial distribution and morphology protein 10 [Vezdaea acicularis]|nr:MAG: Mitochondrial distribution and morphology protein 10 [Vezdaea acicularis]
MLEFMDYVQNEFYKVSNWNQDNSYGALTATTRTLLDFKIPWGIHFDASSLSSPNLATSYSLGSAGVIHGSISYLYSSLPLNDVQNSSNIELGRVIQGYRQLQELRRPDEPFWWEVWRGGRRVDRKNSLLFGRLYLPTSMSEGLYLRRLTPTQQVKISYVSDSKLRNGGTILALHARDVGKYCTETLFSTDSALLGIRGLYNFGPDPRNPTLPDPPATPSSQEKLYGRLSAGGELYYGVENKSGGMSAGLRFTTLPQHTGFPLTMTLTTNPLMGNLSAAYAVKAGKDLAIATQFDFNFYSYESGLVLGCELWRRRQKEDVERSRARENGVARVDDDIQGVLKARINQSGCIGLLWEGRMKDLLFSFGSAIDLRKRDRPFRTLGIEFQYSS